MAVWITGALVALTLVQSVVLWRVTRDLALLSRVNDRLSHFSAALALLADTTEAGLGNLAAELEQASRRRAARSTRGATAKRIVNAVRRGRSVEEIAAEEAVSESEIRLHLGLASDLGGSKGEGDGSMRS